MITLFQCRKFVHLVDLKVERVNTKSGHAEGLWHCKLAFFAQNSVCLRLWWTVGDKIGRCISGCWFFILINGELSGIFQSSGELGQGDPTSPSLFIVKCWNSFSWASTFGGNISRDYLWTDGQLSISHLSFADDIFIFVYGQKSASEKIISFMAY